MSERRITRSVSTEYQSRLAAAQSNPSHSHQNGYIKGLCGFIHEAENLAREPPLAALRNTTEEILIKSLVEGIPAPSMEGIGFTSLPHPNRIDSEELFHSWMSLGEGQGAAQFPRHHQTYNRKSNDMAFLLSQQTNENSHGVESIDQFLQTNNFFLEEAAGENKGRNAEREPASATEPSHSKWFSQARPMTRSHSSELRRRYAAMQGSSPSLTDYEMKQTSTLTEGLANRRFNQLTYLPQVHQSAFSPLHGQIGGESISSFVTLLKGTLERKRMGKGTMQQQHRPQLVPESCYSQKLSTNLVNMMQCSQNQFAKTSEQGSLTHLSYEGHDQMRQTLMDAQMPNLGAGFIGNNQNQPGLLSHAPSPSESSVGAPVLSTGEDPCNSGQTNSFKRSAQDVPDFNQPPKRQNSITTNYSTDNGEPVKEIQRVAGGKKMPHLTRMGSATSSGGSGVIPVKEDPTKKRRVERQRKMAEAKGRSTAPMTPSEFQATVKRCETLEKEVRSLKLHLSFMNRKDSEQTKQIEELQKQNEDLQEEKEKLLEEVERLPRDRS